MACTLPKRGGMQAGGNGALSLLFIYLFYFLHEAFAVQGTKTSVSEARVGDQQDGFLCGIGSGKQLLSSIVEDQ